MAMANCGAAVPLTKECSSENPAYQRTPSIKNPGRIIFSGQVVTMVRISPSTSPVIPSGVKVRSKGPTPRTPILPCVNSTYFWPGSTKRTLSPTTVTACSALPTLHCDAGMDSGFWPAATTFSNGSALSITAPLYPALPGPAERTKVAFPSLATRTAPAQPSNSTPSPIYLIGVVERKT